MPGHRDLSKLGLQVLTVLVQGPGAGAGSQQPAASRRTENRDALSGLEAVFVLVHTRERYWMEPAWWTMQRRVSSRERPRFGRQMNRLFFRKQPEMTMQDTTHKPPTQTRECAPTARPTACVDTCSNVTPHALELVTHWFVLQLSVGFAPHSGRGLRCSIWCKLQAAKDTTSDIPHTTHTHHAPCPIC
jgi:hypothetical protein